MRVAPSWRTLLLLAAPLGLGLVMWQAAQVARDQALQTLEQDAENELRLSAAGLIGHLSRHNYLPQLLATREAVQRFLASPHSQDAMPLNLLLDRFRATADVSDVYLLDRHADTLAASNWHLPNTFIGQNYAFRSYYTDAIAGGQGRFYGLGVQSLERGYYFSAPVWLDDTQPDSSPDGVMVIKVLLDEVEESWADQDAELLVTDEDEIIFMASREELRMTSLHPLSEEERQALLATRRYADEPLTHSGVELLERRGERTRLVSFREGPLSGPRYLAVSRPLEELGWEMHILKSVSPVIQAQWVSALLAGGLYGIVLLGGGIGWQRLRLRREREQFAERERQTLARARDELERNVERRTWDLLETNRRLSAEIDERRRAEESLRQTRDELIQAAKLAVLGQLAAGINHELNQPLAAIRAYAENARTFLARQRLESVDLNLEQIVELTARMSEISAQLRQFSRKSGETLTAVSPVACFDYALRLFQTRLRDSDVEVIRRWPDQEVWVRADLVRLEQVLVNLIGNALQAMADTPSPRLELSVEVRGDQVVLGVADNGPGIAEENLTRIFEPFFTTKSSGKGLGLGLSISSRIVDDLGGRLSAANRPKGGALFTIRLPRDEGRRTANVQPDQETLPHV
ncbi:ATP-binding protein [Halomonas sp. A11-A]|uniref:sensor histidine kinase n=1 Tax=Halomonas sp. A11-A TaxID=2183985 RepID=UPI000D8A8EDF|nr:ATP-binding protein [Halomonas sp. A11-A]PWV71825.1 two-component system C4-dicarboxylate transport sensor histidine kinase DctB [Halomonas sp. A11-A]